VRRVNRAVLSEKHRLSLHVIVPLRTGTPWSWETPQQDGEV